MNTELRKIVKNDFEKYFFKLMNNAIFGKTMKNVRNNRNIELIITEARGNYLVSEPNCHTTKIFSENLLAIEMKKTQILINKPIYLGLPILEVSKTVMCEFWYDYVKLKYEEKSKLCYMDTDSFIVYIKTEDIHADIAKNVEERFDSSNNELEIPLPRGKNKKLIRLMKDKLGGKIMKEFAVLRLKNI